MLKTKKHSTQHKIERTTTNRKKINLHGFNNFLSQFWFGMLNTRFEKCTNVCSGARLSCTEGTDGYDNLLGQAAASAK
jgi:hypothetical protein